MRTFVGFSARRGASVALPLGLLAFVLAAQSRAEAGDGDVSLPEVKSSKASARTAPKPGKQRVDVRVDRKGRLLLPAQVNGKAGWVPAPWQAVRSFAAERVRRFTETERIRRQRATDSDGVSMLDAVVAADAGAPWQHVQWTLVALAEAGLGRIWIAVRSSPPDSATSVGGAPVLAYLRVRLPAVSRSADPTNEVLFRVPLRVQVRRFGKDGRPAAAVFRMADAESHKIAAIGKWVADAKKAATGKRGARLRASPHIDPMISHGLAVKAIGALLDSGLGEFEFVGTAVPDKLRGASALPYPKDNRQAGATWGRILAGAGLVAEPGLAEKIRVEASAIEPAATEEGAAESAKKDGRGAKPEEDADAKPPVDTGGG